MDLMIVDDEEEILKMLERHFASEGIEVHKCVSAQDALEDHRSHLHPVVLTDIRMPGMSGMELIRELKKIHPTTIPFIMTGFANLDSLVECLEIGAVDYFHKPLDDLSFVTASLKEAFLRHERWKRDLIAAKAFRKKDQV